MKFFFPDSHDLVDPSFNFTTETRSAMRIRHRDDLYPHEVFTSPPYSGLLLSKATVDGTGAGGGKFTLAQRHRLFRTGVHEFFRLEASGLEVMGDCGAFAYVREDEPPFSAEDVVNFYEECGFDHGMSVDHIVLAYNEKSDLDLPGINSVNEKWIERQKLSLSMADDFLHISQSRHVGFTPIGVAQGWSPQSYAEACLKLQSMGYQWIALGGMVSLRTEAILDCLKAVNAVRRPNVGIHLLGVTRCEQITKFRDLGVVSFDSTSPLRQAFKEDTDNYHTLGNPYTALRVPQVDANPRLARRIRAGEIDQGEACRLSEACMKVLPAYDNNEASLSEALECLLEYERLHDGKTERREIYTRTLSERPWNDCPCEVCQALGIHVMIFRGAERNRRRGFHNLHVFSRRIEQELTGHSTNTSSSLSQDRAISRRNLTKGQSINA